MSTATTSPASQVPRGSLLELLGQRRDEFVGFLRRRTADDSEAEDVLQQALLTATSKIDQLRDPELLVAWFYRVLRRTLTDHRAREAVRRARAAGEVEAVEDDSEAPFACRCVLDRVGELPPQYADVLRRVDIEEQELAVVAASLGTTTGNVAVRLHRARKALRERLLETCGTTSSRECLDCNCGSGENARAV